MKTTTDPDENGIAERQEQLVQQRMSAMLTTTLFSTKKRAYTLGLHVHQTTQLKHLELHTAACMPEPVNDVDKLKQRLIEVLAGCMQQTVVAEATSELKRSFWVFSRVK